MESESYESWESHAADDSVCESDNLSIATGSSDESKDYIEWNVNNLISKDGKYN